MPKFSASMSLQAAFVSLAVAVPLPGIVFSVQANTATCLDLVVAPLQTYELTGDETHECISIIALGTVKTNSHTLTITGPIGLNCLGTLTIDNGGTAIISSSAGLSCAGTINIEDGGTLVLAGGSYTAIAGTIRLKGDDSLLHVTGNTTLGDLVLGGKILGEDPNATIRIDENVTLTSYFDIKGTMTIRGPGKLDNRDTVVAVAASNSASGLLVLAADLNLTDADEAWWVAGFSSGSMHGTLEFRHAQTGNNKLRGILYLQRLGTVKIVASMVFDNAGSCPGGSLFIRDGDVYHGASTLIVDAARTLTYRCYATFDGCPSPGSGTPYVVTSGTYVCP